MQVGLIYARGSNQAFGRDNRLPWFIPEDLEMFKNITTGHAVIMGRQTWDSLPARYRPLPDRINIVITHTKAGSSYQRGVYFVSSMKDAINTARTLRCGQAWVIGGPAIIKMAEPWAEFAVITSVDYEGPFDVAAPRLSKDWVQTCSKMPRKMLTTHASCSYHFQVWRPKRLLEGGQTYE